MTENEFRTKMIELGWHGDYVDEVIENRKSNLLAGLNPPPLESYLIEAPISD